jgi:hypothetical protein
MAYHKEVFKNNNVRLLLVEDRGNLFRCRPAFGWKGMSMRKCGFPWLPLWIISFHVTIKVKVYF